MTDFRPIRGRGRPVIFDTAMRARYLTAVTTGMRLADAARHVGIGHNVPRLHARTDTTFGEALTEARQAGRKVRQENTDHGEYRYNHLGCRCPICTHAATSARTGRRHTEPEGKVIDMPPPDSDTARVGESPTSFSLLRAC